MPSASDPDPTLCTIDGCASPRVEPCNYCEKHLAERFGPDPGPPANLVAVSVQMPDPTPAADGGVRPRETTVDADELKAQLRAVTAERDALRYDHELGQARHERDSLRLPAAVTTWWPLAGLKPPFTPGALSGNNDGVVWDADGHMVANCAGWESRADVIASLLNHAAAALAPAAPPGDAGTGQGGAR